jgi:uncharacterized protein YfcZ (UPF0381/DUF406 family)
MNTKEMWASFDRAFVEMDKFFEQMDRLFEEARKVNSNVHIDNPDQHQVRFRAQSHRERIKLAWNFFCLTVSMIFRGQATVVFRRRKSVK